MKKTFIFGLIAAALGFTACSSEDDLNVNDNNQKKGMVLRATVEQPAESRATFTDGENGAWVFDFAKDDEISVTNMDMSAGYYTFTNDGTEFKSEDAKAAESTITWYAYFPSNEVDLTGQTGAKADVANLYALAGATASATTGEEGLNITMSPKVAILVINNLIGEIDINVKNSADTWVYGMKANAGGFDVLDETEKISLLKKNETGTYYVVVPAGVQLAIKDGDKVIASTGTNGLTAGKYYNLTIAIPTTGYAKANIGDSEVDVKWIQLWKDGLKFAEFNVGAANNKPEDFGDYGKYGASFVDYATTNWGDKWRTPTIDEWGKLFDNCTYEWTAVNGVNGCIFTGKDDYKNNSIFLPAAGYNMSGTKELGETCKYLSATMGSRNYNYMYCKLDSYGDVSWSVSSSYSISYKCPVRAVLAE